MTDATPVRILLGPQSPSPTVGVAADRLPQGPLAVISAGWQEAEGDLEELSGLVARPLEDMRLYGRVEEITAEDPALAAAIRARQDLLVDLQRLYRLRLKQLAVAARRVIEAEGDADLLMAEQRHAIAQLRALDRHHLTRSQSIWSRFQAQYNNESHPLLARHARELREHLQRCAGVLITGGNVAVLINRMRLLGLGEMLRGRHIVAWSAGAMVLTDRIVLFHERSPEGRRDAEVLGAGCGVVPGYVVLPDANRRLRTRDRLRIGLMSRRFAPDVCAALDSGSEIVLGDAALQGAGSARQLRHDGRLARIRSA